MNKKHIKLQSNQKKASSKEKTSKAKTRKKFVVSEKENSLSKTPLKTSQLPDNVIQFPTDRIKPLVTISPEKSKVALEDEELEFCIKQLVLTENLANHIRNLIEELTYAYENSLLRDSLILTKEFPVVKVKEGRKPEKIEDFDVKPFILSLRVERK
jgi:hypothetical protein